MPHIAYNLDYYGKEPSTNPFIDPNTLTNKELKAAFLDLQVIILEMQSYEKIIEFDNENIEDSNRLINNNIATLENVIKDIIMSLKD